MYPLKELPPEELLNVNKDDLRRVNLDDFRKAVETFIPSYNGSSSMKEFEDWGTVNFEI